MNFLPSWAPHWHLILNHFPSVGGVFAVCLLAASYYVGSEDLRRASLMAFVIIGLLTIPTFITGSSAGWELQGQDGISSDLIAYHQNAAIISFTFLLVAAWLSWMALWQYRRFSKPNKWIEPAVLVVALLALVSLVTTGSRGGNINHPELVDQAIVDAAAGASGSGLVGAIETLTIGSQYVWPTMEALHFLGMALLFGVLVFICARMFGLARSISFAALHRILPLAVFGFMVNVITGMLLFVSNSGRYVAMTDTFYPKMGLIVLGGLAVLYYTVFDRPWALKPDDEPPALSKGIAAVTVLMWTGVLIYGRWLPYGAGG